MANEEHLKSLYRTLQDLVDNRKWNAIHEIDFADH